MSDSSTTSGGIGFTGLLQIVFITLKLCKVITWSWWWVMSPMLIGWGIVLIILIGCTVAVCFDKPSRRRRY